MLGKQEWKLLTEPNALISRVLKARYFPGKDFLGARIGHNPSYSWRSIWNTKAIVKEGVRWRVGDEKSISVWDDPWLRCEENPYIQTPRPVEGETMRVTHLIRQEDCTWNIALLQSYFQQRDIDEIIQIPVYEADNDDIRIWRWSKDGRYSVRSAYHNYRERVLDSSELKVQGEWNLIWKLEVPAKVKSFIWRLCRRCIPTRIQLQGKGIDCPGICSMCDKGLESAWHLFLACDVAKQSWQYANLWSRLVSIMQQVDNVPDFIFKFLSSNSNNICNSFALILTSLWKSRNECVWENKTVNASQVVHRAKRNLVDWQKAKEQLHLLDNSRTSQHISSWSSPPHGVFKCNVDAAFFEVSKSFGCGFCLRDDQGRFLQAATTHKLSFPQIHEGEALALVTAIKWLLDWDVDNVIIELDCQRVVQGLCNAHRDQTEFGSILLQCRALLIQAPNYSVSFIRRQANSVAHALARVSNCYAGHQEFSYVLSCIEHLILTKMI